MHPQLHTPIAGRGAELATLDALLEAVRAGESQALVVRGDPGIGKSALLEHVRERAAECRVVLATGVQTEMELPFAGLHLLCAPLLERLERLPEPQRAALATAFGLSPGPVPDRFLVGLATLSLLADVASPRPLICLIDDAQWLDRASAQVLAFVARRLQEESIALVFATRERHEPAELPELVLDGLDDRDGRALLRRTVGAPVDEQVADRIVAETRGNPLALLELPRGLTPEQLAGGFGLPDALPLSARIEQSFLRRLERLPPDARRLLLVAAAEPVGDPILVWRAATQLGIAPASEDFDNLCEVGTWVRFRHPLVRSAVYRSAPATERRRVHGALAEATDPELDPDRRAWHRAHATAWVDEDVAAELERCAGRAQARGGLAAAAAFLEKAAQLTPDPAVRAERALAAAEAKHDSGAFDAARALLATVHAGPDDEWRHVRADLLRGRTAYASTHGSDAPPQLLAAARRIESFDADLAIDTYLNAFAAALFAGRLGSADAVRELAAAARGAPDPLLDGLARLVADGFAAGAPALAPAVRAEDRVERMLLASHVAAFLWDFETLTRLSAREVESARDAGALHVLPVALTTRAGAHLFAGELAQAAALIEETAALGEIMERQSAAHGALPLAALQGREADALALIELGTREALARGEGLGLAAVQHGAALLYNGKGLYHETLAAVGDPTDHPADLWPAIVLPELIEAAVRGGQPERAEAALARLSIRTRATGTEWALGIEARSRALVGDDEALYREALARLARTGLRIELARTHLVYGEWLRRERRRTDAREHLRTAHAMLAGMGVRAFAERAERELRATGATMRKRAGDELTTQEARSRSSPPTACRTRRSARGCSSAPAPSSTTCTRSSRSWASARAKS